MSRHVGISGEKHGSEVQCCEEEPAGAGPEAKPSSYELVTCRSPMSALTGVQSNPVSWL